MRAALRNGILVTVTALLAGAGFAAGTQATRPAPMPAAASAAAMNPPATRATAIFAGGCFWCLEADFDKLPGVIATESGYTAGRTERPTYEEVSSGATGHTEGVRVTYDPAKVNYEQLITYFWRHIDPTVKDRQFCDIGSQYRSGIYWSNAREREIAESSRAALLRSGTLAQVETEMAAASEFYPAEEYHQDYYLKNPIRYSFYRRSCGRDARVQEIWGGK